MWAASIHKPATRKRKLHTTLTLPTPRHATPRSILLSDAVRRPSQGRGGRFITKKLLILGFTLMIAPTIYKYISVVHQRSSMMILNRFQSRYCLKTVSSLEVFSVLDCVYCLPSQIHNMAGTLVSFHENFVCLSFLK